MTVVLIFSAAVDELLSKLFELNEFLAVTVAILLSAFLTWLFFYRNQEKLNRLVKSEARILDRDDLTPRKYLIAGFSIVENPNLKNDVARLVQGLPTDKTALAARVAEMCNDTSLYSEIKGWQQSLRMFNYLSHRDDAGEGNALKAVYLIDNGAKLKGGGEPLLDTFLSLVKPCFPDITFHVVTDAKDGEQTMIRLDAINNLSPDYENYRYVSTAFDRAFELIVKDSKLHRSDAERATYIDVTAGVKVFSIAGAIQTLNREAIFVYVTTNTNLNKDRTGMGGYDVLGYDADAQFNLSGN